MKIRKVFCLFEQSGTFKNAFRKHGIEAEDYDILNDFGETDHQIDLFVEIEKAFEGMPSLFDEVGENDMVVAFFPCTRFEIKIPLLFRGEGWQQQNWNDFQKLEYSMKLHNELHHLYMLISKLFYISLKGKWKLIVENPYHSLHYLNQYFPIKPKVIIKNRRLEGDYYVKPTQFFFLNCDPKQNLVMQPMKIVEEYRINDGSSSNHDDMVKRSLIHPQFADRFIKTYILDKEDGIWT